MMDHQSIFDKVVAHVRETKLLGSINALLDWDQQTKLPAKATNYRAEQATYLAGQIHGRQTDPQLGEWLGQLTQSDLASDPQSESGSTIRELHYRFQKKQKLPLELVKKQAALHSRGQRKWAEARKNDDFQSFQATLEEIFRLKREEASAYDSGECLYDNLLDDFEPGALTSEVTVALTNLRNNLLPLIERARDGQDPKSDLLYRTYPLDAQKEFVVQATSDIGFDYERGRLDIAHHPFCTETGPNDCRITTRYDASMFHKAFYGCLHEAGHGMYEQGLRSEQYGLPPGSYCSLGVHESQSRMWENLVGRSLGFWKHFLPKAQTRFTDALNGVTAQEMHQAVNRVEPSLIRVEADETTYDLHVIIRFELEQALLNQDLQVADLPDAWNEKYQHYLGITPPNFADGVLQDVHWSAGLIGYFSTYSLGNIYASMLFEKAGSDLGDLESQFEKGDFQPLLCWLRENVHQIGNRLRAPELMELATGYRLDHGPLVRHLERKVDLIATIN